MLKVSKPCEIGFVIIPHFLGECGRGESKHMKMSCKYMKTNDMKSY